MYVQSHLGATLAGQYPIEVQAVRLFRNGKQVKALDLLDQYSCNPIDQVQAMRMKVVKSMLLNGTHPLLRGNQWG